jgi:hypothetical protein
VGKYSQNPQDADVGDEGIARADTEAPGQPPFKDHRVLEQKEIQETPVVPTFGKLGRKDQVGPQLVV